LRNERIELFRLRVKAFFGACRQATLYWNGAAGFGTVHNECIDCAAGNGAPHNLPGGLQGRGINAATVTERIDSDRSSPPEGGGMDH
jgi:hypothetical protein